MHNTRPLSHNTFHLHSDYSSQIAYNMHFRSKSIATINHKSTASKQLSTNYNKNGIKLVNGLRCLVKDQQKQYRLQSKPKMIRGKLHLGQISKPQMIIKAQYKNNHWVESNFVSEHLINKKGLMAIIQMGIIPKNIDYSQLLNVKYEQKKIETTTKFRKNNSKPKNQICFQTKLRVAQLCKISPQNQLLLKQRKLLIQNWKTSKKKQLAYPSHKKQIQIISTSMNKLTQIKPIKQQFPTYFLSPSPSILQINNQKIQKNEIYCQQLKLAKVNGKQPSLRYYISKIQQFSRKYNLKKFQFKLNIDQTRKISQSFISTQIINAAALGICWLMKGKLEQRAYNAAKLLAARFKYKKAKRDLLKVENVKKFFKVKKFYELMTKQRADLLKCKFIQFSCKQLKYIEQSRKTLSTQQRLRAQIHIIAISGNSYEDELSYYKIQCRNNIQLTRLFSRQPQYLILLIQQNQYDLSCWLQLIHKVNHQQNHPIIIPLFSNFSCYNYKVKNYNSIYYGMNKSRISIVKKICGNKPNCCLYPNSFNSSLIEICQILNVNLYSGGLWKSHQEQLLAKENQQNQYAQQEQYNNYLLALQAKCQVQITKLSNSKPSNENKHQQINSLNIETTINKNQVSSPQHQHSSISKSIKQLYTPSQLNQLYQRNKIKQYHCYQLASQHFTNKLNIKCDIFIHEKFNTPQSIIFSSQLSQSQLYKQLTNLFLENKNISKWVFKIGLSEKFSRGLAFLEIDSLKIIKQKKKKLILTQTDIEQVSGIMKVILLDKLQIPQNSLHDSDEYLQKFLKYGGYIQAVIQQTTTQCIFGRITPSGQYSMTGTYSKIYTDGHVNCAAMYPSSLITKQIMNKCRQLSHILYKQYKIFGYVTYQILIHNSNTNNNKQQCYYFIDLQLSLQQYSSLYFMYDSIFHSYQVKQQDNQTIFKNDADNNKKMNPNNIYKKKKRRYSEGFFKECREQWGKTNRNRKISVQYDEIVKDEIPKMLTKIIYIPFIDNNENTFDTFSEFQNAQSLKKLKSFDFQSMEGIQFLYLNLKQQKPDVLSMIVYAKSQKQLLKYTLQGLNFVVGNIDQIHKFDKKIERRKCDCLYLLDIIWKFRELKKNKDNSINSNNNE